MTLMPHTDTRILSIFPCFISSNNPTNWLEHAIQGKKINVIEVPLFRKVLLSNCFHLENTATRSVSRDVLHQAA